MSKYDDIIDLPHHTSKTHPRMSMSSRAAQFAPFAALTGYGEAIDEAARATEMRHPLSVDETAELNERLLFLFSIQDSRPEVDVKYFLSDEKKLGGHYEYETLTVRRVNQAARALEFTDGRSLPFSDIADLDGDVFSGLDQESFPGNDI